MRNLVLTIYLIPLLVLLTYASPVYAAYPPPSGTSIDGSRQVYMAWYEGNWEIFMHNTDNGEITRITDNPHTQGFPDIWGNYIVWQDNRDDQKSEYGNFSIYLYDIRTQNARKISPDTGRSHENPVITDGKVVWTSLTLHGKDIYVHDIASGKTEKLTTAAYNIAGLKFDGNIVAWLDLMNKTNDLYVYDIKNSKEIQLTAGKEVSLTIALHGGRVAWSEKDGIDNKIKLYDVSTKTTRLLTINKDILVPLSMNENYLLVSNNNQYSLIDLATGKITSLNPAIAVPDHSLIHANYIIWVKGSKIVKEPLPDASTSPVTQTIVTNTEIDKPYPVVLIDGKKLEASVILENGTTLVPLRDIFEALGADVIWNGTTQTVTAIKGQIEIKLTIGSNTAYRNGQPVTLQVPGKIVSGKTMVPLRFVSEALGAEVNWDGETQTISINSNTTGENELYGYTHDQIRRALACGAVYKKVNNMPYDMLLADFTHIPSFIADNYIAMKKKALSQAWGVYNREDALRILGWLRKEGHRRVFNDNVRIVSLLDDEQYQKVYEVNRNNPSFLYKLEFIKKHINEIPKQGILAWDYCRLANLATDFYTVGYISKDEAIKNVMYTAKILQNNFSSWEEMAQNHLFGREYWGHDNDGIDSYYKPAVEWLLNNDESPWLKYSWDYPLGNGEMEKTLVFEPYTPSKEVIKLLEGQNKFVFNQDYKLRDKILGIEVTWGQNDWNGIYYFNNLDVSSFENLLLKKFVNPSDAQNEAPPVKELFLFMSKHPNVMAHGYAVSPKRNDYRVTIEGLYIPSEFVTPRLKKEFVEFCKGADEINTDNGLYSCWN